MFRAFAYLCLISIIILSSTAVLALNQEDAGKYNYASRLGMKRELIARSGGSADTELAVLHALKWLSKNQNADGSWGSETEATRLTAQATLAFMGAGFYYDSRDIYDNIRFGDVITKALAWLKEHQDESGFIGSGKEKSLESFLPAALALVDCAILTGENEESFTKAVQRAVDAVVAATNNDGGWGDAPKDGNSNMISTCQALFILINAKRAGLTIPDQCMNNGMKLLKTAVQENGSVEYAPTATHKVDVPKPAKTFKYPVCSAVALQTFIAGNHLARKDPIVKACAKMASDNIPPEGSASVEPLYWHLGSLALYQYDGPSGPTWIKWNMSMKKALVKTQVGGDDKNKGSWDPSAEWKNQSDGRIYTTALNGMTLETYYRFPVSVFGPMR